MEIASYTDITALLSVIQDNTVESTYWKYKLYGNISWEYGTNTMYHCGKYEHFSYKEFEDERIILHKLPQDSSIEEIKDYLDKQYLVLCPINTKTLGHTALEFRHNVLITGYGENGFVVYDFWAPSFNWKFLEIEEKKLFGCIDFSNDETVQSFYVFMKNEQYEGKAVKLSIEKLSRIYINDWNIEKNGQYDIEKNAYADSAYEQMCNHLNTITRFTISDCQNLHVIYDHFIFSHNCLKHLFGDNEEIQELINIYDELTKRALKVRKRAFKYYVAKKNIESIREEIIEEILDMCSIERKKRSDFLASIGGNIL